MRRPDLRSRLVLRRVPQLADHEAIDVALVRARTDRAATPLWWRRRGLALVREGTIAGAEGPLPARLYVPPAARGTIMFFHGGGFVLCGLESHDGICAALARAAGARVLSVAYRLAPEHPFPAAPEDCFAAWRELAARAGPVAVAGDSAGANLAAVVALMARDRGVRPPAVQVLFYPPTTGREAVPSRALFGDGYFLTERMMAWFERLYLGGREDERSPYYMPAAAPDLARLPPALIVTAEFDPLRDEGHLYAARMRRAGVAVAERCVPGTIHGFLNFLPIMPKARRELRLAGRLVRRVFRRT